MKYINRFACLLVVFFFYVVAAGPVMAETYTFSGEFEQNQWADAPLKAGDSFSGVIEYDRNCVYPPCVNVTTFSFDSGDVTYDLSDFTGGGPTASNSYAFFDDDGELHFYVLLTGEAEYPYGAPDYYSMSIQYYVPVGGTSKRFGLSIGFDQGFSGGTITSGTLCEEYYCAPPILEFTCNGFEPPLGNGLVKAKKNRTIPVKAKLFDSETGVAITGDVLDFDLYPTIRVVHLGSAAPSAALDAPDFTYPAGFGSGGSSFDWNPASEVWQYNLRTKGLASGTYEVTIGSADEDVYSIGGSCKATFAVK